MIRLPIPQGLSKSEISCRLKVRHKTESKARRTASRCAAKTHRSVFFYKCPHCDGWHLTHKEQRRVR